MTQVHSIYDKQTGLFTGQRLGGPDEFVAANVPEGCGSMPGEHDHLRWRVEWRPDDFGDGFTVVVAWKPPAPADNVLQTFAWDEQAGCWVGRKTSAAIAQDVRADRAARLAACDWVVARSMESGDPVPAVWRAYRQALRDVTSQPGFPEAVMWPDLPGA